MSAPTTDEIRRVLGYLAQRVREVNEANGWFDAERSVIEGSWLLASEAFEAGDAYRKYGFDEVSECHDAENAYPVTRINGYSGFEPGLRHVHRIDCKPIGYGSELADVLIRLLDQCDRDGVDLVAEFDRKLAYNATRGYRHGGRKL